MGQVNNRGGPKRIKHRIIGLELELGTRVIGPSGYYTNAFLREVLSRIIHACIIRGALDIESVRSFTCGRFVLPNQGQCYSERNNHLEYASPECRGTREAVLHEVAGMEMVADGVRLFRTLKPQYPKVHFYKGNRNCEYFNASGFLETWGHHANYLIPRRIGYEVLRRHLVPFLMTRPCIIGNGWVEPLAGGWVRFYLSQRANLMTKYDGPDTTGIDRAFINTRDEPHADKDCWRRLHDISGNSNMSEWQLFLKYGTFDLMLMLLEENEFLPILPLIRDGRLNSVAERATFFNADIKSKKVVFLAGGEKWNALDFQRFYIGEVHRYIDEGRGELTPERRMALELWEKVIDALDRWDLAYLAQILDWAAILYYCITPLLARLGLEVEQLIAPLPSYYRNAGEKNIPRDIPLETRRGRAKLIDYLLHLLVEYANVETDKSSYGILLEQEKVKRLFKKEEIERAADNPPPYTRAAWREKIFRWIETEGVKQNLALQGCGWEGITIRQAEVSLPGSYKIFRTIQNPNPYLFRVRELEKGRPQDLLREIGSAW
ncbi:MAG: proteasome accessory factor PafA2 family protein [Candidatus Sungiibacteriota bacterium]|uniref:Proteasome accessory factor PafA2 family protein n=1 Tax=Candidatus Sungiibacteriota bacterium TaxID=2750080 RepID=A0A7T5RK55_9BACT|nr:MAG: proteasome accessory factor PafA2 family protein [Candidatus Sungbacteria bacterium]